MFLADHPLVPREVTAGNTPNTKLPASQSQNRQSQPCITTKSQHVSKEVWPEPITTTQDRQTLTFQTPHLVTGQYSQAQTTHLSLPKALATRLAPLTITTATTTTLTRYLQSSTPFTPLMITSIITQSSRVAGFQEVGPTRDLSRQGTRHIDYIIQKRLVVLQMKFFLVVVTITISIAIVVYIHRWYMYSWYIGM